MFMIYEFNICMFFAFTNIKQSLFQTLQLICKKQTDTFKALLLMLGFKTIKVGTQGPLNWLLLI